MPIGGGGANSFSPDLGIAAEVGVVPEYEVREAAVYAHIPWPLFCDMDYSEKIKVIAHHRTRTLTRAWEEWAARQSMNAGR